MKYGRARLLYQQEMLRIHLKSLMMKLKSSMHPLKPKVSTGKITSPGQRKQSYEFSRYIIIINQWS